MANSEHQESANTGQYAKLPSVVRRHAKMSESEQAIHAAILPMLDTFQQRKVFWCSERHRMMPPTIVVEDQTGAVILEVIVRDPSLPAGHNEATSARDGTLVVAERLIRGLGVAHRMFVAWDMYHYAEAVDGQPATGSRKHDMARGSMQEAHKNGSAAANGISEILGIYVIERAGRIAISTLPFEWDFNRPEIPPQWFPETSYTFVTGDSAALGGVIQDTLLECMKLPLFIHDPKFREGIMRVSRMENIQPPPEEELPLIVARSTLQLLASEYGCVLIIPEAHPFGPDIEGLIAQAAGDNTDRDGLSAIPRRRVRDGAARSAGWGNRGPLHGPRNRLGPQ